MKLEEQNECSRISTSFEYQCMKSTVSPDKMSSQSRAEQWPDRVKKKTDRGKTKKLEVIHVKG